MADKMHRFGKGLLVFHCPGCGYGHPFYVEQVRDNRPDGTPSPVWSWNGSMDKPTFSPSLLVFKDDPAQRCHSFVTDGKIQFLSDCFHHLKNQTVEIPDWDD